MSNPSFSENLRKLLKFTVALAFLLFVSNSLANAQTTTFASFQQRNSSAQNFVFTNNTTNATFNTVPAGNRVYFLYDDSVITGLPAQLIGFQNATITLTSSTSIASSFSNGSYTQPVDNTFTLAIIRDTAASVGVGGGTRRNLLTVTVNNGTSNGELGGSGNSATYSASQPGGQSVVFTSDFLDFTQSSARNFGLSFSSVTPAISSGSGGFLSSFTASGLGTFASDPPPFYDFPTSSEVNVSGRVQTADGSGIKRAQVSLTDARGAMRIATSDSQGYYNFTGVQSGQAVVVSATAKRISFAPRIVSVSGEITNLDFTAQQ